jgi:hypothetical protein
MQFKIDENLPIKIAELLINAGYDAKTVNDQQLQGIKDSILEKYAKVNIVFWSVWIQIFLILGRIHHKNFRALLFYG